MIDLDPGELTHRITFMRAGMIDDGTAEVPGPFTQIGKRWSKKSDASDGERVRAAAQGQELTSRFLVRHDSLTETITAKDRIVYGISTYEVTGTKEARGRRVGIEITAIARPDTPS